MKCQEKGHSPATVKHVLQCVRAVYNFCIRLGDYVGENPTRNVKFPRLDNARKRFFSDDQVDALLSTLAEKNADVHDMTLLSILAGCVSARSQNSAGNALTFKMVFFTLMGRMGRGARPTWTTRSLLRCSIVENSPSNRLRIPERAASPFEVLSFQVQSTEES